MSTGPCSTHTTRAFFCPSEKSTCQVFLQQKELLNVLVFRKIFRRGHFRSTIMLPFKYEFIKLVSLPDLSLCKYNDIISTNIDATEKI